MARGLLWLGLVLLGTLQAQGQDSPPSLIPAPHLDKIPLQPDFQEDQFQGKWYVLGIAENSVTADKKAKIKMYATTYKLLDDHSYNVTTIIMRDQHCDRWGRTYVPNLLPGQYTLGNIERYVGVQNFTMRVMTTNYQEYAMLFFKKVYKNKEYFKLTLYGRSKKIPEYMKIYFTNFAKALRLTDDHVIFPVATDKCINHE